jgi:integrase
MGRKPTVNKHLPPGMRAMRKPGGVYYYLDHGKQPDGSRPATALGKDYVEALRQYADLVQTIKAPAVTVPELLHKWQIATMAGRATKTREGIAKAIVPLLRFFADPPAPLSDVEPQHIKQYLAWRKTDSAAQAAKAGRKQHGDGSAAANREIAWLSAAWNWGRDNGLTRLTNPCAGVRRNKERGRAIYIEDSELAAISQHADEPLREALELAYLLGQRPGDLRDISETDIRDGAIQIEQSKTGKRVPIAIVGELAVLIDRIKARKSAIKGVRSLSLLCDEHGQPMTRDKLRYRFDKARALAADAADDKARAAKLRSIQFRDLRAKAGTDKAESSGDIRQAQKQLGHTTVGMTERYIKQRKGDRATPTK